VSVGDDWVEVMSLLARYAHLIDDGRRPELDTVFTPDARIDMFGEWVEGLAAFVAKLGTAAPANGRHHLNANFEIHFDGDEAEAVSDWFLVGPAEEAGWNIRLKGRYQDRLRRTADGWRIVERRMSRAERRGTLESVPRLSTNNGRMPTQDSRTGGRE